MAFLVGRDVTVKTVKSKRRAKRKVDRADVLKIVKKTPMKELVKEETELEKHRANITALLEWSNATPIRRHSDFGYACCFCPDHYPEPADLKRHTLQTHQDVSAANFMQKNSRLFNLLIKLDITALRCKICDENIHSLEQLLQHLPDAHQKHIFTDIKNQIIPFKFDNDMLQCHICSNMFSNFKPLQEHMKNHFANYTCEVCKAGFVTRMNLLAHNRIHMTGTFACSQCPKVFSTMQNKTNHEKGVHAPANRNKCGYCDETFKYYQRKEKHLIEVHGIASSSLKCQACEKAFANARSLRLHIRKAHLMEREHKCSQCDMSFFKVDELRNHMVKHTGVREFQCAVCLKAYGRKKTLREHMRIHEDDRRFKCEHCKQSFVQKCSWRSHMRSKHGEDV